MNLITLFAIMYYITKIGYNKNGIHLRLVFKGLENVIGFVSRPM